MICMGYMQRSTTNREFRLSLRKFLSLVLRPSDHQIPPITGSPDSHVYQSALTSRKSAANFGCGPAAL
jgi:hypothetical protein